jgi:hypothetical protein
MATPVEPHVVYHHGSHTKLLRPLSPHVERPAGVNAIVVPTARPHTYLTDVVDLAARLNSQLVLLCSHWADAGRAVEVARRKDVRAVAVDISVPATRIPQFQTSEMLKRTRFEQKTDTSLKRNVGLAIARMVGWRHVLFLDDDIKVDSADDIRDAAALADSFAAVGLINAGFPDNSVVCHAYRRVGGIQGQFVGGGAMVVPGRRCSSFFPTIYNEDWFFLLNDEGRLSPVTATGKVDQKFYEPFRDPERARSEEFGDCLAEGVYALLDDNKRVRDAVNVAYWRQYLGVREQFIKDVLDKLPAAGLAKAEELRIEASLKGASGRLKHITPQLCVDYLNALHTDRKRWQQFLKRLPRRQSAADALRYLGLNPHTS